MQKETSALYLRYECRGLCYIHLRGLPFSLQSLVRVSLSVIANDWQLEVLPLEAIDQQEDVAYNANNDYN